MPLAAALLAIAAQAAAPGVGAQQAPSPATPAQDVADISTRVCFGIASGTVKLPAVNGPADLDAERKAIEALGLTSGLDTAAMDGLGQAGVGLVSRATIAARANGTARTILAINPQACRVALVADEDAGVTDRVAAALTVAGWRAGPPATQASAVAERRMFLRRDAAGKAYLLNLQTLKVASARLRLFTTVAAIPAGVQLPQGF